MAKPKRKRRTRVQVETYGSEGRVAERPWAVRRVRVVNPSLQRLHALVLAGVERLHDVVPIDQQAVQYQNLLQQVQNLDVPSHRTALTAVQQQFAAWTAVYPEVAGHGPIQAYRRELHLVLDHEE